MARPGATLTTLCTLWVDPHRMPEDEVVTPLRCVSARPVSLCDASFWQRGMHTIPMARLPIPKQNGHFCGLLQGTACRRPSGNGSTVLLCGHRQFRLGRSERRPCRPRHPLCPSLAALSALAVPCRPCRVALAVPPLPCRPCCAALPLSPPLPSHANTCMHMHTCMCACTHTCARSSEVLYGNGQNTAMMNPMTNIQIYAAHSAHCTQAGRDR